MNLSRLGVGVIGLGIGEQHALAFAGHPQCHIAALCDKDAGRIDAVSRRLPQAKHYTRAEDLIDDPEVHVVSVASHDDDHSRQVIHALALGKHVFVEKPLCRTLEELAEIKAYWCAAGGRLKLRSNLVLRGAPLYQWLKQHMTEGRFGRLYAFDGDYLYGRLHKITAGWRASIGDYSVMGGGGVHLVDLLLWLTGERPVYVAAMGNRICTADRSLRCNDFLAASLEFESQLIARITANFGCMQPHQHVLRLFGTQATLLYDDTGPRLYESREPTQPAQRLGYRPLPEHKGVLIPEFVSAILQDTEDTAQTQSFFDGISVCVAADSAATSGSKERIVYV